MDIVIGRGKNRQVVELPCGALVAQSAKEDPKSYQDSLALLCPMLGVIPH